MSDSLFAIDLSLHDVVLVDTAAYTIRGALAHERAFSHGTENIKDVLVAGIDTVKDQRNNDPLPSGPAFFSGSSPELGFALYDISDIEHHTVQSSCHEGLVFVVIGDCDLRSSNHLRHECSMDQVMLD